MSYIKSSGQVYWLDDIDGPFVKDHKLYFSQEFVKLEDQKTFRELRNQGLTAPQARDAMKAMGIGDSRVNRFNSGRGYERAQEKQSLPHYHGKRRF